MNIEDEKEENMKRMIKNIRTQKELFKRMTERKDKFLDGWKDWVLERKKEETKDV